MPTFLLPSGLKMPSAETAGLVERIAGLSEQAAKGTGIEIAEAELRGGGKARLVRVYIDKPGGVTHADCELISQRLGKLLDDEDAIPGAGYTLEVSSPGVERKLSKPRDFGRVVGQKIRLTLREPVAGETRLEGRLEDFDKEILTLETPPGRLLQIPLAQVQKANLKFEW